MIPYMITALMNIPFGGLGKMVYLTRLDKMPERHKGFNGIENECNHAKVMSDRQ